MQESWAPAGDLTVYCVQVADEVDHIVVLLGLCLGFDGLVIVDGVLGVLVLDRNSLDRDTLLGRSDTRRIVGLLSLEISTQFFERSSIYYRSLD